MSALSRELRSFIEIAGEGSLRSAAEKLNISPSALSRQIQMLERDFGAPLLVRVPRGVRLTEQGKALLKQAEGWVEEEEVLRTVLNQGGTGRTVTIRLGIMECLASSSVLAPEEEHQPLVNFDITVATTGLLTQMLYRNELDAIVAFNVQRAGQFRVVFEQDCILGLVHGKAIEVEDRASIRLGDCLKWPLCLPNRSLSLHPRLNAEIFRSRANPQIVLRSNSIALIRSFVTANKGVSFLTWHDVSDAVGNGDLHFVPLENRRLTERMYICTPADQKVEPVILRSLKGLATRLARNVPPSG